MFHNYLVNNVNFNCCLYLSRLLETSSSSLLKIVNVELRGRKKSERLVAPLVSMSHTEQYLVCAH